MAAGKSTRLAHLSSGRYRRSTRAVIPSTKEKPCGQTRAPAASVLQKKKTASPAVPTSQRILLQDEAAVAAMKTQQRWFTLPKFFLFRPGSRMRSRSILSRTRSWRDAALQKLRAKGYKAYILTSDLGARGSGIA